MKNYSFGKNNKTGKDKKSAKIKKTGSTVLLTSIFAVINLSGCSESFQPVPVSQCGKVVKHTTSILKKLAKPQAEMIQECRKFTDEQRGCAMQASIVHDLAKCAKL